MISRVWFRDVNAKNAEWCGFEATGLAELQQILMRVNWSRQTSSGWIRIATMIVLLVL